MYKTVIELYEAMVQRKEMAERELLKEMARTYPSTKRQIELKGMISAYKEAVVLFETSDVLRIEKKKEKQGDDENVKRRDYES